MKLVAYLLWIPSIYSLLFVIMLTGRTMPGGGMCNYSARTWCRSKHNGHRWQHGFALCCRCSEYEHGSEAAFIQGRYWSKEQGIDQLNLFTKYLKFMLFFKHKHCISNIFLTYYTSDPVTMERTPKPDEGALERRDVLGKGQALSPSYHTASPEGRTYR